jgi:predicted  nucleic acid-binding Zn-ribbon protein
MTAENWIGLIDKLAWPIIALLALGYIWKSDSIGKLIQISSAVDSLKEKLRDLVDAEERMTRTVAAMDGFINQITSFENTVVLMQADVEAIRDKVDNSINAQAATPDRNTNAKSVELDTAFSEIDKAWKGLTSALDRKFGAFDRRMTGSEVYRFAHGNRKSTRLPYEIADEVARLHSSFKSFVRRRNRPSVMIEDSVLNDFVESANWAATEISNL